MKLDLKNPKQGLYRMTKTVMHKKPDGRAARGWDSREGTTEGTLVRVVVWQPPFDPEDYPGASPERLEEHRKAWADRGPEIDLRLPGRHFRTEAVRCSPWTFEHKEMHQPGSIATLFEIIDALELVENGQGLLDQIDPSCDWEEILAFMLDRGDVKIETIRAAFEAYRTREEHE